MVNKGFGRFAIEGTKFDGLLFPIGVKVESKTDLAGWIDDYLEIVTPELLLLVRWTKLGQPVSGNFLHGEISMGYPFLFPRV